MSSGEVSGSLVVTTTVVSVGPYTLIIRRPPAQRRTSSGRQASPPASSVRSSGSGLCGTVASAAGVTNACVIRASARKRPSGSPPYTPAGASTSAAPAEKAISHSSTAPSNPIEANCMTLASGVTAYRSISVRA